MPEKNSVLYVVVISTLGDDQSLCHTSKPKLAVKVARDLSKGEGPNTNFLAEKGTIQSIKIIRVLTDQEKAPIRPDIVFMIGMNGVGDWQPPREDDFFDDDFKREYEAEES